MELRFLKAARRDLGEIWDYTAANWGVDQADRYLDGLERSFATLAGMPEIAREWDEFTPPVRIHPTGPHLIVYRVEDQIIVVVRILASRRNWRVLLED